MLVVCFVVMAGCVAAIGTAALPLWLILVAVTVAGLMRGVYNASRDMLVKQTAPDGRLVGLDVDPDALAAAGERLRAFGDRVVLLHSSFRRLREALDELEIESVDAVLLDLGVSSHQLDVASRGFRFAEASAVDTPLDMRMNPEGGGATAAELLKSADEATLRDLLFRYGEERFAGRIVRAILDARQIAPLQSTRQLAGLVAGAVPARNHRKGHHPATRTFQALRIAVNDELGELEQLLGHALPLLKPGGRMAVISFHSLEDRLVKNAFVRWEQPCECPPKLPICVCGKTPLGKRLTRKPVTAGSEEDARNPRSRGAKLRAFEKLGI